MAISDSIFVVITLLVVSSLASNVPGSTLKSILYYETLSSKVSRATRQAGTVRLHFIAFNRTFSAELSPTRDGFHPETKFVYLGEEVEPHTLYKGQLQGEPHSSIKGHIINGLFDGIVLSNGVEYHIERASKYFDTDQDFHSLVYRATDVYVPESIGCGAKGEILERLKATQARAKPTREDLVFYGKDRYRRQVTSNGNKFCPVLVAADHTFLQNIGGGDVGSAMAEMVTIVTQVQNIFKMEDFDSDGTADGIVPLIARVEVMDLNTPNYRFASNGIGVEDFLDLWSQIDHEQFCLSLLFSYRDFDGGVLGLAWVAQPPGGNRGGICETRVTLRSGPRFLNTAIVSMLNYGQRQARSVTIITTAHELGHNFGSPHDPNTARCSPGGTDGNYIMFAQATDGSLRNNKMFSQCSKEVIRTVLSSSRSSCFTATGTFCGNGVMEEGEECDCGVMCDSDICCDTECRLTSGSNCSSSQPCCTDSCQFSDMDIQCRGATECGLSVNCTGSHAECPEPESRNNSLLCNNNRNFCQDGVCSGSPCVRAGLGDCQCTEQTQLCHLCCMVDDVCMSSQDITNNDKISFQTRESGRSCNNFAGYCDSSGMCQVVDNEGTLNDLLDLFTLDTLQNIATWLAANWYIPVGVVIGLAILIILLQVTYRKRKPIKRQFSQARNSFRRGHQRGVSEAQTGGVGGGAAHEQRPRPGPPRQITPREAMNRLGLFFPNTDSSVIREVIRTTRSESKAVKKLLDLGYPLKRIPIPRA